nr:dehydration-responsive element-binding protein 1D-like [Tanacetum cinerariifolium]
MMVKMVLHEAFAYSCAEGNVVLRQSYKPESCRPSTHLSYSSGPSTPPSYSSEPSTPQNYSPGSSRNADAAVDDEDEDDGMMMNTMRPLMYNLHEQCESTSTSDSSNSESELKLASQNPKKRAGRKKVKETRHPVFRGVRRRSSGKWVCEVREPNKKSRVWLGTYPTAEMAARAHDVAVLAMRGRSACLNFADSVWRLPVPESSNVKDIQKAAAEAAEAFGKIEDEVEIENEAEFEEINVLPDVVVYFDEEEMFEMPEFIASMAEGLMVPPPQLMWYGDLVDNMDFCVDVALWSF